MNLQETLTARMDRIHSLLAVIADKSGALANDAEPDWGNVGSLGHVVDELEGIAAFLGAK